MSTKPYQHGLWWVKRDFRVNDNDALLDAVGRCERVTALFIIEPSLCHAPETSLFHYRAWHQAAEQLRTSLEKLGAKLHVICGEAVDVLDRLHQRYSVDALFSHEETGSAITFSRDRAVRAWADKTGIVWHEAVQNGVIRGLQSRDNRMPVIRKRLMETVPRMAPIRMKPSPVGGSVMVGSDWPCFSELSGQPLDTRISEKHTQRVTEHDAQADLHSFLHERGVRYSGGISSPNTAFSAGSRLSAHLAWGTLSLRQVFHATFERDQELARQSGPQVAQWRKSLKAFQSRLHWHDHFIQRLESAPDMEFKAINPAYRRIRYGNTDHVDQDSGTESRTQNGSPHYDQRLLIAWQNGQTGLPLVDACMRCLAATGFLNFRMRAMIVSAGCFGLAQSWQSLQYPLARLFLDYEPGIHFSQIQMQAGIVGINTLRVYSPHKQLLDQDPQAIFVKRWIPELREFDALQISEYNTRTLGDYPAPVTDIKANTRVIRDQVYAIRKSEAGQTASADVLEKHGSRLPGNDRNQARIRAQSRGKTRARTRTKARTQASDKGKPQGPEVSAQMTLDLGDPSD